MCKTWDDFLFFSFYFMLFLNMWDGCRELFISLSFRCNGCLLYTRWNYYTSIVCIRQSLVLLVVLWLCYLLSLIVWMCGCVFVHFLLTNISCKSGWNNVCSKRIWINSCPNSVIEYFYLQPLLHNKLNNVTQTYWASQKHSSCRWRSLCVLVLLKSSWKPL